MSDLPPDLPQPDPTGFGPDAYGVPASDPPPAPIPASDPMPPSSMAAAAHSAVAEPGVSAERARMGAIRDEVNKVIVGQGGVLSGLLCAFLADGHVLLEGVPAPPKLPW